LKLKHLELPCEVSALSPFTSILDEQSSALSWHGRETYNKKMTLVVLFFALFLSLNQKLDQKNDHVQNELIKMT
jgi:hypothetical protein